MKSLVIYLLLIIALFVLFYNSNKPFVGHHDWNSNVYSQIARNYNRYGLLTTKFGQIRGDDVVRNENFIYFTHYPPLLPVFIAISFRLLGESEVSGRLVPIVSSIGMLLLIYLIGKEIKNYLVGLVAAAITIAFPIFIYFGKLPVHETVLPFFVLLVVYFYTRFLKERRLLSYFLMIINLLISEFISWPGYYIVIPLILHSLFFVKDKKIKKMIFLLFPLSIISFVIFLTHLKILTGSFFNKGLLEVFLFRTNLSQPYKDSLMYSFTLLQFVKTEVRYFLIYFTKPVLLFSFFSSITFIYKLIKKQLNYKEGILFVLFLFGITHITLFTNMAFIHDYMIYYMLPFIALSASWFLVGLSEKPKILSVLVLITIILMLGERLPFAMALLNTHDNMRGYNLAKFIKKNTKSKDLVFIGSNSYMELMGEPLGYYSDRVILYSETKLNNPSQFKLIIRPKDHDALTTELKSSLDSGFPRFENEKYIWYTNP